MEESNGTLYRFLGVKVVVDGADAFAYAKFAARVQRLADGHVIRFPPTSVGWVELERNSPVARCLDRAGR